MKCEVLTPNNAAARIAILLAALIVSGPLACTVRPGPRYPEPAPQAPQPATVAPGLAASGGGKIGDTMIVDRQPWDFYGRRGEVLITPHFEIYTTLKPNDMTLQRLPAFYEACLYQYTHALGELPLPKRPLQSYIFRDSSAWRNKTREMLPDQADTFVTLGRGGFTTKGIAVLYDIGHRDTLAIAAHEGWHQYTQSTFNHALPVWLEEGVATYMEGVRLTRSAESMLRTENRERLDALRRALRDGRTIKLSELLSKAPQTFLSQGKQRLLVYYSQVWALTRFLAEGEQGKYRPALEELLSDAAQGRVVSRLARSKKRGLGKRRSAFLQSRSGPAILMEYFNPDLEAFKDEFALYVEDLTGHRGYVLHDSEESVALGARR